MNPISRKAKPIILRNPLSSNLIDSSVDPIPAPLCFAVFNLSLLSYQLREREREINKKSWDFYFPLCLKILPNSSPTLLNASMHFNSILPHLHRTLISLVSWDTDLTLSFPFAFLLLLPSGSFISHNLYSISLLFVRSLSLSLSR